MQVIRRPDGLTLYFPPLRAPGAAATLAALGASCIALPALAVVRWMPAGGSDVYGMLEIIFLAGFAVPVAVFGAVFIVLALYMLVNSLTVTVDAAAIVTVRRVLGLRLSRCALPRAELAAIESRIPARYQSLFSPEPCYQIVARNRARHAVVIAESLCGEPLMTRTRALIADAAGFALPRAPSPDADDPDTF